MVKIAKAALKKSPTTDLELRRWCIEQAIRWPTSSGGYGAAQQYSHSVEADLIGRAEKLLKWIST